MRFLGTVDAKTDSKGRAFLPSVFRKVLQSSGEERLVLRRDVFQPCLTLYPESVWNGQVDNLTRRLNRWSAADRQLLRQFVSDVEVIQLDGNGRFLIPKRYQRLAGIVQDVKFIGVDDTIEIWAAEKMEESLLSAEEFASRMEEKLGDGLFGVM